MMFNRFFLSWISFWLAIIILSYHTRFITIIFFKNNFRFSVGIYEEDTGLLYFNQIWSCFALIDIDGIVGNMVYNNKKCGEN